MIFLLSVLAAFIVAYVAGGLLALWVLTASTKYGIAKGLNL